MTIKKTKARQYNRITPQTIMEYKALEYEHGNGTAAVVAMNPTILSPKVRAFRIRTLANLESPIEYIDNQLQQIGIDAINRVGNMVNSNDEHIATKNSHYAIDHLKGKAVTKSLSIVGKVNIGSVLD